MGQLNGFGPRRRARREQHNADVLRVGKLRGGLGGSGGRDELIGPDDLLARARDDVEVFRVGNDQRLRQPVDQLAQTVGAEAVVERRESRACARRGEQQKGKHCAAQADVGHVGGAGRGDDACTAVGELAQFSCRKPHLTGHQRGAVRVRGGCHLQQQRDAHGLSTKISRMGSSPPP